MQQIAAQDFQAAKAAIAQDTQDWGVLRIEALGEPISGGGPRSPYATCSF